MVKKKVKCKSPGVRYREHDFRKHGIKLDKYFFIRYKLNGKDREEALGWSSQGWTEKKAAARRSEILENIRLGVGPQSLQEKRDVAAEERKKEQERKAQEALENLTFAQLMDEYLEWAKTNKRHQQDEGRFRLHLENEIGALPLRKISPFHLEKIKKKLLEKGLAPASVKHCLVLVRQAFNKAIDWGKYEGKNPIKGVKLPKLNNRKERVLTYEEESALLHELKQRSMTVWCMAVVALNAGLRFEEITKLKRTHLDFGRGIVHVDGKGGKPRIVPMNNTLRNAIEEYFASVPQRSDFVFSTTKGTKIEYLSKSFWNTIDKLGMNEGVEDRRYRADFHALRHTWATRLGDANTPLNVLRDLGGWADFQMVSRYCKSDQNLAAEAVKALDAIGKASDELPQKIVNLDDHR